MPSIIYCTGSAQRRRRSDRNTRKHVVSMWSRYNAGSARLHSVFGWHLTLVIFYRAYGSECDCWPAALACTCRLSVNGARVKGRTVCILRSIITLSHNSTSHWYIGQPRFYLFNKFITVVSKYSFFRRANITLLTIPAA